MNYLGIFHRQVQNWGIVMLICKIEDGETIQKKDNADELKDKQLIKKPDEFLVNDF